MTIGEMIHKYRIEHGMSQREFALKCGLSNATISMYEKNGLNPKTGKPYKIEYETYYRLAALMGISIDEMFATLGNDAEVSLMPPSISPIRAMQFRKVPLVGSVAAGEPIFAEQTVDTLVDAPTKADYALRIQGESMEPTYITGDIIYIKAQPDINYPGQVAVVLLDDEATVKHVYKQADGLMLISDNPAFAPMIKRFADYATVRILGIVCGFTRMYT